MPRGSTALQIVDEPPAREPDIYGDPTLTQEAVAGWTAGQRKCRARGRHSWGPGMVYVHPSYLEVMERCTSCRNKRLADFSKSGRKLTKWKPGYRDGYLLPKGAAPIVEEFKDELVLEDLLSRKTMEVNDDEE